DFPCRLNLNGDFISGPGFPLKTSILIRLPSFLSNSGFGSNRSTALGAPSMNSQITALALAGKCVGFGANGPVPSQPAGPARSCGGAARRASRCRRSASATAPNPAPAFRSSSRRSYDARSSALTVRSPSIDVDELVQSEKYLAVVGQSLPPNFGLG